MIGLLEEAVGWALIGWMFLVLICVPLAWAWLIWDERRVDRLAAAQDEAVAIVNKQKAMDRHPAGTSQAQIAPDDDPRFAAYVQWRKEWDQA